MSGNFTLFQPVGAGSGAASGDFVKDAFSDISVPANSNNGLTSTALTNPGSYFFSNDDCPRYGLKTLFIKELVLIEDRTKWYQNKPTYEIIWNETYPAIKGYVFGNIRLRNFTQGKCIDINNIGDGIGITTIGRQISWLVNPSTATTASAEIWTDGVDTSTSLSFANLVQNSGGNGLNHYYSVLHQSTLASENIHDYQLRALQYGSFNVVGVQVMFLNATADIECNEGTTYVDKAKVTTQANVQIPLPTITSQLGARSTISKDSIGNYNLNTVEQPTILSIATGSSGTNLLNVSTGTGQSYLVGMGIVSNFGTSMYVGMIRSISTDTLTVSPTLAIGVSGNIYNCFYAGPTLAISATLYQLNSLDFANANTDVDTKGFGVQGTGDFYYSDPQSRFRIWGDQLAMSAQNGYQGVAFNGATVGFLQLDGNFNALELELSGNGIIHGTFSINGIPAFGLNEGFTGVIKKTIFTDAGVNSFNNVVFSVGASFGNVVISRVNMYDRTNGVTLGTLAGFDSSMDRVNRGSVQNATFSALGPFKRHFADELYLTGSWIRGLTSGVAGGVLYHGASLNSVMSFNYYGTDFAILGVAGTSAIITLDGASITTAVNTVITAPGPTFHTVTFTNKAGTSSIHAFDHLQPEVLSLTDVQNYLAVKEVRDIPKVFNQADTPRNPIDGDIWNRTKFQKDTWIYLFGVWNKLSLSVYSDDPNISMFIRSHGAIDSSNNTTDSSELFNGYAWVSSIAPGLGKCNASSANCSYNGFHYAEGGTNTAGTLQNTAQKFNKFSWQNISNVSTPTLLQNNVQHYNVFLSNKGYSAVGSANGTVKCISWDDASWTTQTSWATACGQATSFFAFGLSYNAGGIDTGGNFINTVETKNSAFVNSVGTVTPVIGYSSNGGNSANGANGTTKHFSSGAGPTAYEWNNSAWATITISYTSEGVSHGAYLRSLNYDFTNGGCTTPGANAIASSSAYIGTSYLTSISSAISSKSGYGSSI